jgi:hypothetical protein
MLRDFNEGRSKTYYCIAATVLDAKELRAALVKAKKLSSGMNLEGRSTILHSLLDGIAGSKGISLKLRK